PPPPPPSPRLWLSRPPSPPPPPKSVSGSPRTCARAGVRNQLGPSWGGEARGEGGATQV
ncbi:hypothetical protein P7K49_038165, partial [Saguinus oedipus]